MAASITRGYSFGSTELVTNTKLHTLVDGATISGLDATNLVSGSGLVIRSTSAPSNTSSIWVDTNFSPPLVKVYDGATWRPQGTYAILTNKSGSQRTAGDVVVVGTSNDGAFTTTTTQQDNSVLGVVLETIANNADGVIALPGARVQLLITDATTSRGNFLVTSTTAAKATPVSTMRAGVFAIALSTTAGAGSLTDAILLGTNGGHAFKISSFSRDISTASGSQAVTGVGFKPIAIIFLASTNQGGKMSIGFDNLAAAMAVVANDGQDPDSWLIDTTNSINIIQSGSAQYTGKLSVLGADGFTTAWTKTGTPTGTVVIPYLAIG